MDSLFSFLKEVFTSPEYYAAAVAIGAAVRGIGEVFVAIGKIKKDEDMFDTIGAKILLACDRIGQILRLLGLGSKGHFRKSKGK